ncbi:alpha-1,6-mannosylglycoprotein 6-beta-N-acetylglucosaminyltransferase A-like [Gasterosteus aculeatus]
MRKVTNTLWRSLWTLLGIGVIWVLSLSYFILSDAHQEDVGVTGPHRPRWLGQAEEQSPKVTLPPSLRDHQQQIQSLQIQIEAEKEKGRLKDEMIGHLRSDELQLHQQVAHMEKLVKLQEEKKVKTDYREEFLTLQIKMAEAEKEKERLKDEIIEDLRSDKLQLHQHIAHMEKLIELKAVKEEDEVEIAKERCSLPPLDGFPDCKAKLEWMKVSWRSDPCYSRYGVNGSLCSFLIYLSEIESWCPLLPGRVIPADEENLEEDTGPAVVRGNLSDLYSSLQKRVEFRWIHQRIVSMEEIWVEAGRSLSAKYNVTGRKAKQILVYPGALTSESGFRIAEAAFSGGPLGELVQWSDLISTLYILGHHLHFSVSKLDLRQFLAFEGSCPTRHSEIEASLIYTDIVGLKQIQEVLKASRVNYRCKLRILDTFGTEPDFNHVTWAQKHNLNGPFGGLNLIPMQFYTMFPHTPDNTFLGFVVQHQLSAKETERLNSTKRQNQALVYGKRHTFWEGKEAYLDVIHKHMEVHGTVDHSASIPSYVINHGIIKGSEVQVLLRQSKVFVGLSFPYEGPAPLEAIANGCVFLNPKLDPPRSSLNTQFFKGKPNIREVTSQNPYAEAIGEPYVWMVDIHNSTDVERALTAILNQTIEPHLPYEFSCEGMLQRVNILIEKQDFCNKGASWPPLSALRVLKVEANTSCKQACQQAGLICEPAFFPHVNNAKDLLIHGVDCQTSELSDSQLVFPAFNRHRKHCVFQSDPLLFSCVRSDRSLTRICPCRDYIKEQIALCKACI